MKKNTVPTVAALLTAAAALSPVLAPRIARAETPSVAGVGYPAGGRPLPASDKSVTGFGRLLGGVAGEFGLPDAPAGNAEVVVWEGDAYKPGRAGFRRSAFRAALAAAGYAVEEKENSEVSRLNPFEAQYGLAPNGDDPAAGSVSLSSVDSFFYFKATNPKTKTTLVGAWADQEGAGKLVLAVARVGYKAAPAAGAGLPALPPGAFLVQDPDDAMKGLTPPASPAFAKLARKPRTVRGTVKDGAGRPITNARFVVWASAAGGFRTEVKGVSDAQGRYEIPLPVGVCQVVNADCRVRYNGAEYLLPLEPADGEREHFNSAEGAVENFVLRTWGKAAEGGGAYGGTVRILEWVPETGNRAKDGLIEVTLTPDGPLLDGSAGRTLVLRFPNGAAGEKFLHNVPLGRYKLTAALLDGGERLPLRAKTTFGDYTDTLPVVFVGENGALATLGKSGVRRFDVTLQP